MILNISVSSASLASGVYSGTIMINAPVDSQAPPADNTPQGIEVALTVGISGTAAPGIGLSPNSLALEATTAIGSNPTSATVQVTNTGGGVLNWTAAAETYSGGNWLSLTVGAALTVTARVGQLGAGTADG